MSFQFNHSIYNKNIMRYKVNQEEFEKIIKECLSIADVCRKLNLVAVGGNYKTINSKIKLWNIDISHFTGQGWNVGMRYKAVKKNIPLYEILVENSTYTNTNTLKKRLFKEGIREKKCEICRLTEWLGIEISLELHHKNGNNLDRRDDNNLILCPNCHSQTDHFRGGNIKSAVNEYKKQEFDKYKDQPKQEIIEFDKILKQKKIHYCSCGNVMNRKAKQCMNCYTIKQRKVERPELNILLDDVKQLGYRGTGKKYGVSDNSIKKWIK